MLLGKKSYRLPLQMFFFLYPFAQLCHWKPVKDLPLKPCDGDLFCDSDLLWIHLFFNS